MTDVPECLECGACCKAFGIVELHVIEDADTYRALYAMCVIPLSTELGYDRMPTDGFRCKMLGPDNACRIYEHRPHVCRRLARGGALCRMAIEHLAGDQGDGR